MQAANSVVTRHSWVECFLDWSQRPLRRDSPDGIHGHMFISKASFRVGGHRVKFYQKSDGLRQVHLTKTRMKRMKPSHKTDDIDNNDDGIFPHSRLNINKNNIYVSN